MGKQFRDVTGGEKMLTNIVPGLGFMNYLLGWFTVPAEVFLRRNFGERYYTRANFLAGLILLLIFYFFATLVGKINPLNRTEVEPSPLMWRIIKWYCWLGIFHFLHIWWNDIMGHPAHSFSAGQPWLSRVGKAVMWVLNLFLNLVVRLLVQVLARVAPRYQGNRLEDALPVLRDANTFTERFIEPAFMIFLAMFALDSGENAVFFWLFFSVMALNFYTGMRHQNERAYVLDIRDQLIEGRQLQAVISGRPVNQDSRSSQLQRVIEETAKEAEREPEVLETIRSQQPSLADAVAAFNARKNRNSTPPLSDVEPAI